MCVQLIKEILIQTELDAKAKNIFEFFDFYRRSQCAKNSMVDEFEQNYSTRTPIGWLACESTLSRIIHQAFSSQDVNAIMKMRFFIRDLHQQIEKDYTQPLEKLTLYRGQRVSDAQLGQLRTMQGDLFFFNSFLATSTDYNIALLNANHAQNDSDMQGIIFQIKVDPSIPISTPFVSLDTKSSQSDTKEDFLFSVHTVFRIGEITEIEDRLWQVELLLVGMNDDAVQSISEYIRQMTVGSTAWDRLGKLLLRMGLYDKAERFFEVLLENSGRNDFKGLGSRYHQMGTVKKCTGFPKKAIIFYNKAIKMYRMCTDLHYSYFVSVHHDIGLLHQHTNEYAKALEFHRMAIDIEKASHSINYSNLAIVYADIAEVNKCMNQYSAALQFYQVVRKIHGRCVPFNFRALSATYRKMAEIQCDMEEFSTALKSFETMLNIQQHFLPQNYLGTATIETSIGRVFEKLGEHSKTAQHYENAIRSCQMLLDAFLRSRWQSVEDLASIYDDSASIHIDIKNYQKALEFYQKILGLLERYPYLKKMDLITTYKRIARVYQKMDDYKNGWVWIKKSYPD